MQALAEGPRAADQYAAVTASVVTLIAATAPAQDLLAALLRSLALALEEARAAEDSIAAGNIVAVVCYMFVCKAIGAFSHHSAFIPAVACMRALAWSRQRCKCSSHRALSSHVQAC